MLQPIYYFAFGSNMFEERLEYRVGRVNKVGVVTLKDYELVFNTGNIWHSFGNIVEKKGAKVEGVAYELTERQINILDHYENWPFSYQKFYFTDPEGRLMFGYWSTNEHNFTDALPDKDYLSYLIEGALENDLDYTYQKLIKFKKANYKFKLW